MNSINGDGCSNNCTFEPNFNCTGVDVATNITCIGTDGVNLTLKLTTDPTKV